MNAKSVISGLIVATLLGLNTVHAKDGMAMTWKTKTPTEVAGKVGGKRVVVVGCQGCDAYTGDTKTTQKRHILCIVPGNAPVPGAYSAHLAANNGFKKFYYGWSGGKIGLTKKIKGTQITSRAVGDQICKSNKGLKDSKARMIEHHDNKVGGWNLGGFIHPNSKAKAKLKNPSNTRKFWAGINDKEANPWNP